tara:strand:+ start:405 stop:767 length:363 start_codon:yes stop_codon:yes gene_type:complete
MKIQRLGLKGPVHTLHGYDHDMGQEQYDSVMSSHAIACTQSGVGPVMVRRLGAMSSVVDETLDSAENQGSTGIYPIDVDPNDNGGKATMTLKLGNPTEEESIEIVETNCVFTDDNYGQVQ